MFNKKFLKITPYEISSTIAKNGFFFHESALTQEFIKSIIKNCNSNELAINKNSLGGVMTKDQYYNTNILATSKTFFNLCTSDIVLSICNYFFKDSNFRLKAYRYYETYSGNNMQWHNDTKTSDKFLDIKGLIFIVYISDVFDGEFQYVNGSHINSNKFKKNDFTSEELNKEYGKKSIISFKGKKGSLIIYNTAGIHRAKPAINKKSHIRKSLFFQVDLSNNSEPIILNPSFIDKSKKDILTFLGFGKPCSYQPYPNTNISDMPTKLFFAKILLPWVKGQPKKIVKKSISIDNKLRIKWLIKKLKDFYKNKR